MTVEFRAWLAAIMQVDVAALCSPIAGTEELSVGRRGRSISPEAGMGMTGMGIGHACLRRPIGFGPGVKGSHPADLVGADAFRRAGHPLRTKVCGIRQYAGQHGRYILRRVSGADVGELIGKRGPLMHLSEQVWNLDQRIHLTDLGVQIFGRGRNIACVRCDDQRSGIKANTFQLSGPCAIGEALEVEVQHLSRLVQPGRTIAINTEPELVLFFHGDECRLRHEVFIDRSE
ncbi:hypothetical protein AJ87_01240 [Rhizobium yanglingense]|nr:hypothetical protein AJ87_01240 [Rhizobium yanglingense]